MNLIIILLFKTLINGLNIIIYDILPMAFKLCRTLFTFFAGQHFTALYRWVLVMNILLDMNQKILGFTPSVHNDKLAKCREIRIIEV